MKKTIAILLMLVILLPSQAFAASVSTSYVEKLYFESYKDSVKEVRAAQKKMNKVVCPDVQTLTSKSKASMARYKTVVKSKPSKDVLAKAKADKDQDKKLLSKAKKECSASKKNIKKESNQALKDIAVYKAGLVKVIKTHLEGKDSLSQEQFTKTVHDGLTHIDSSFRDILNSLRTHSQ
ncbi:hypothetical protein MNQ98_16635 [Paenibacillus sp. N3/727]|uniref:hypothetical protein n=1 Tax=Paenibacillus sp. N3/727 TaxID=2925845 RepID=UPI001F53BB44|nr:hypothetical protein [Paenibacillus sp. N3/727]UNK16158.1 hypothetical protein MNQ98_16635 [Paenibacillus sp. N3/727]